MSIRLTGTDPSAGDYMVFGTYDDHTLYVRTDLEYMVYWYVGRWVQSAQYTPPNSILRLGPIAESVAGEFLAVPGETGTLVASEIAVASPSSGITALRVLTKLNAELSVKESVAVPGTAVSMAFCEALRWLSMRGRWKFLYTTDEQDIEAAQRTLDRPDDMHLLEHIVIDDSAPMKTLEGGYRKWLENRGDEGSYAEPENYLERANRFYLDPLPDTDYTATISYWAVHATADNILTLDITFPLAFERALVCAVAAEYLDGKGRHNKATYYRALAEAKIDELRATYEDKIEHFIQYEDL